jgi:hypothetical protein
MKLFLVSFILFCSCASKNYFNLESIIGKNEDQLLGEFATPYFTTGLFENGIVYGYKYNPKTNTFYDASVDMHNREYAKNLKIVLFHLVNGSVVDYVVLEGPISGKMFQPEVIRYFDN